MNRVRYICRIGKSATATEHRGAVEAMAGILRHCHRGQPTNGDNETGISHRVLYHKVINSKFPFDIETPPALQAKTMLADCHTRSARKHWHIILSAEDGRGSPEKLEALRNAFIKHFNINAAIDVSCHGDHQHLHEHLIFPNYDPVTRKAYDLLQPGRDLPDGSHAPGNFDVISNLGFAQGIDCVLNAQGKLPFLWRTANLGQGKSRASGTYSKLRQANSQDLAERIQSNPAGLLKLMVEAGDVELDFTKGRPSLRYQKTRFSLRDLNYFLGKTETRLFLGPDMESNQSEPPVYLEPYQLKAVERDAQQLEQVYRHELERAVRQSSAKELDRDVFREIAGLASIPGLVLGKNSILGQAVSLCGRLAGDLDMGGPER